MAMLGRWLDQLPALVSERRMRPLERGFEVRIDLHQRLPSDLATALASEAARLEGQRSSGAVFPETVTVGSDGLHVLMRVPSFDAQAVRLDRLLERLSVEGAALGSALASFVVGASASRLRGLHERGRVEADLGPRRILIGPGGGLALVCPGLPLIGMLLTPAESREQRWARRAPELLLGASLRPSADVYLLGALYYELASGTGYRQGTSPSALERAARAELPPELPGALGETRGSLVQLLRLCLDPSPRRRPTDANAFLSELKREAASSGVGIGDRAKLARLLEAKLPPGLPRGPQGLIEATPSVQSSTPDGAAPPAPSGSNSGWAAVLGDDTEDAPHAESPAPDEGLNLDPPEAPPPETALPVGIPLAQVRVGAPEPGLRLQLPEAAPDSPPITAAPLVELEPGKEKAAPTLDSAASLSPKALLTVAGFVLGAAALVGGIGYVRSQLTETETETETETAGPQPTPSAPTPPRPAQQLPKPRPSPRRPAPPPRPEPEMGLVSIMSTPLKAQVSIDGGYVGDTPLVLRHQLDRRSYTVVLEMEGYERWERVVRPKDGKLNVMAKLAPK